MLKRWNLILVLGMLQGGLCLAEDSAKALEMFKIDGKTITLARYAKAFIGEGNVTVEVAPYQCGNQPGAILLFHGIESPWDGKAIVHEVRRDEPVGREDYATTYQGHDWVTLVSRQGEAGQKRIELFVPGIKESIPVTPSDGAAQLTSPRKIFQEYQEQHRAKK